MNIELIDDETLDSIPEGDPGYAFVLFERACRKSLMESIHNEESGHVINTLQLYYMHDVIAAAQHYGIPDVRDFKLPKKLDYEIFEEFSRKVRFFTTHYRLTAKAQRGLYSVELQGSHKDRIRTLVAHLKLAIDKSDFPERKKASLQNRILDFEKELDAKRLKFAEALVCISLIGAAIHGVGQGAEGLGKLINEIVVAIGQSKELEDDKLQLLPRPEIKPPAYLIDGRGSERTREGSFTRQELDDEIPF